jgi:hypothetical protein
MLTRAAAPPRQLQLLLAALVFCLASPASPRASTTDSSTAPAPAAAPVERRPAPGWFELERNIAYLQPPLEVSAWNASAWRSLDELHAAGLNTLLVSPDGIVSLLKAATPDQRELLRRFDFVTNIGWPGQGLDIGDVDDGSDFLPPWVLASVNASLALALGPPSNHSLNIVGYYTADEAAWNKQSLYVASSSAKGNMVLMNGFGYVCGAPGGGRGDWYSGFDVGRCQRCLTGATAGAAGAAAAPASTELRLSREDCGTAGHGSPAHWDWAPVPGPIASAAVARRADGSVARSRGRVPRTISIQNNATGLYLCSKDMHGGLSLEDSWSAAACSWLVNSSGTGPVNTAASTLRHVASGRLLCGATAGALSLSDTLDPLYCGWETYMWSAGEDKATNAVFGFHLLILKA